MNRVNPPRQNPGIKETQKRKRAINFLVDVIVLMLVIELSIVLENYYEYMYLIRGGRLFVVLGGYYLLTEFFLGKTIGKFLTGTRVVNSAGDKISFREAAIRTICRYMPLGPIIPLLGVDARVWHDVRSKTYVVDDETFETILDASLAKK